MKRVSLLFMMLFVLGFTSFAQVRTNSNPDEFCYQNVYYEVISTSPAEVKATRGYVSAVPEDLEYSEYSDFGGILEIPSTILFEGVNYSVVELGYMCFEAWAAVTDIILPPTLRTIGQMALSTGNLYYIELSGESPYLSLDNGILYNADKTTLICCPNKWSGDLEVPSTVTEIVGDAFNLCTNITTLTINSACTMRSALWFTRSLAEIWLNNPDIIFNENLDCSDVNGDVYINVPKEGLKEFYVSDYVASDHNIYAVIHRELNVEKYTLMGDLVNDTYSFLLYNMGKSSADPHAMMAVPYNYSANNWGDWVTASAATPGRGQSFLVYTTNKERGNTSTVLPDTKVELQEEIPSDYIKACDFSTATLTNGEAGVGAKWFALCNPYVSRLNLNKFKTDNNAKINGSYAYLWNQETNDWEEINITGATKYALYPGTGFMVAGTNSSLSFNFNRNQYATDGEFTFKSTLENQDITFVANSNGLEKKMYAAVDENATNGFDGKDSYIMFSNNEDAVNPYFKIEGRDILDNRFNTLPATFDINFHSQKSNIIDFSLLNTEEDIEIALIDLDNNEETILNINEAIQINVSEGENEGRYQLRFSKKNVGINEVASEESSIQIFNTNSVINVSGKNLKNIEIYNTLGQVVYSKNLNTNSAALETNLNNGAYIVKVSDSKSNKTEKIIIR